MRAPAGVLGSLVVAVLLGSLGATTRGDDLCARFGRGEVGGTIAEPRVAELSGLAASRAHPGVVWGHNDSGGAPELHAFAEDGTSLGTHPIEGAEAVDWEDMASGPDPDGSADVLYVGDIGDNDAVRPTVVVYRVSEPGAAPTAPGAPLTEVEAIELRYPGGPSDAEALLIDPRTGDLVIVTKRLFGAARVLTAEAAALAPGAPVALTDAGELRVPLPDVPAAGLPGTAVTGGDVSPDGSVVLLRTYRSVLAFERGEGGSVAEALLGEPCFAPQVDEPQGEAIAFTGDGSAYLTASEGTGVPIHRIAIAAPATTTTTEASTSSQPSEPRATQADGESSVPPVLVAVAVVLLLVGGSALALSRRRRRSAVG